MPSRDDELRYVGKPVPRVDGFDKVTGAATFVHDIELPGMLCARVKRSPHASARITRIDTSKAENLPGVHAVLTGKELDVKMGLYMIDKDILARDVVRYQGEMVAAVAADSDDVAQRACDLIQVHYEPMQPVLDPRQAMREGAPLVHEDLHRYEYMKGVFFPKPHSNIPHHQKIRRGDIDQAFREAHLVTEHSFYNPPVQHAAMETHTAIAQALPNKRVEIITSAQSPYTVRNLFCHSFKISHADVRVRVPYVGGGFGGKAGIHLEPLAYCLSLRAGGRPVKVTATREEEFNTIPSRQGLYSHIETGVSRYGLILGLRITYIWDAGAYADYGVNIGRAAAYAGAGPYHVPNCHIDSYVVYTNKVFGTAYRGFGHLEVLWGIERNMDMVARTLGMDPYDFRQKNLLRPGDVTITGEKITEHHGRPDKCLEAVAKEIGWGRNVPPKPSSGKVRGKGLAMLHKAPAMPPFTSCATILKFNEDASVDLLISGVDYGQGTYTALCQIAAEELKLPLEKVRIPWESDTAYTPYDWQTVASRFAFMGGNAVMEAARDCLRQIKSMASDVLRAPERQLVCEDGHVFVAHHPDEKIPYERLVMGYTYPNGNSIGGPVIGHGRYIAQGLTNLDPNTGQGLPALDWTYGAHGVEVEVDVDTGTVDVVKIVSAFDVGKVLNPQQCRCQVIGGVVQGIGSALWEEFLFDDSGRLLNPGFTDYKIPTAKDIPQKMLQVFVETPQLDGPYGARGVAEHPMISVPSAIGNALYDALGVEFFELPLSRERVFWGIQNRETRRRQKG